MRVGKKKYTTLWIENKNKIKIIDQTQLPFEFRVFELKTLSDFCSAIKDMNVRGAPLIGVTAAFGLALSVLKDPRENNIKDSYEKLFDTRPTAVNLKWALDKILNNVLKVDISKRFDLAFNLAIEIRKNDILKCQKIGEYGCKLLENIYKKNRKRINILTHCNAGWLATIDWGTALSPIYKAFQKKIPLHVWVDETRPRNQGSSLTAWELKNENVPYTIICDNAGGHLMQNGKVDLCLVGSDRTSLNGDVCNKIGTYLKAIAAFENKIPFYVALPTSTIDRNLTSGINIPIENRGKEELSDIRFFEKKKLKVKSIYFKNAKIFNPAFDVTPSKYITGLITEKGICKPNLKSINQIFEK